MKKLIKIFVVLSGILIIFFSGTILKTKYHVLKWENTAIRAFLELPEIDLAVFNFNKTSDNKYKIGVSYFNESGALLGTYPLKVVTTTMPDLDNVYPLGLFFLKADTIFKYSANGTKTLYFVPIPNSTGSNPISQYVSYEIYDEMPPAGKNFSTTALVGTMKPSPPYM